MSEIVIKYYSHTEHYHLSNIFLKNGIEDHSSGGVQVAQLNLWMYNSKL